jgi:uncharacterized membrane protein YgcG
MGVVYSNRRHGPARLLAAVALAIVLCGATSSKLLAQSPAPERILAYDVKIGVLPDSTMEVEESIRVHAAGNEIRHGLFRDFPTEYTDAHGDRREVRFQVTKVLRDGKPEHYTVSSLSNGKRVRVGSADVILEPGEYTYVIGYKTDHQLGFFPDHDELYWNATGFWGFEIDKVTVRVSLPDVPADQIRLQAYTGPSGATGTDYTAEVVDGVPTFRTTAPFGTYEGITIVVGWPKGFVTAPPPVQHRLPRTLSWEDIKSGDWWKIRVLRDASGIAMATCALIFVVLLGGAWLLFGRDPQGRSITVAYEPPEHLSPAAVRYVRTRTVDAKALTAVVLDLAAKKYVTIRKEDSTYAVVRTGSEPDPPLSMDEDVAAQQLFKPADATSVQALETMDKKLAELEQKHPMLAHMAESVLHSVGKLDDANTVYLRRSSPRLLSALHAATTQIKHALPARSLIRTNRWMVALSVIYTIVGTLVCISKFPGRLADDNWVYVPAAIIFMAFNAFATLNLGGKISKLLPIESFAGERSVGSTIGTVIGALVAGAIVAATGWIIALLTSLEWAVAFAFMWLAIAIFSRLLQQPTALGERYWEEIEGFRQFLEEVDEDRLNRMNPPTKTPELFERMLPYALALDCELAWAKKFESVLAMAATAQSGGQVTYSPSWYSGPAGGMLTASAFTDAFASSFSSAIASSTMPPGSSSGFSGGGSSGSSGGGGGGGGGGGW